MRQIVQSYKNGRINLHEVPIPACKPGGLLVRNMVSLISPGTEKLMIEMGRKSLIGKARARPDLVRQAWDKARKEGFVSVFKEAMNRLDEPIPLGYSAAGVVEAVGSGVKNLQRGDRVAVSGAGYASHAELVWVPEQLCVPIPKDVEFEDAAFCMLGAIALHGVRSAELTLGETAVVVGLGLLGLLSLQFLVAQGCRAIGVDLDPQKCQLALELGATVALVPGRNGVEEAVSNLTGARGADAVIVTAASDDPKPIRLAEAVARERARLVLVGVAELSLTRKAFWDKELSFTVSRAGGPGSLAPLYEAKGFDYPLAYVRWTLRRNVETFLELLARGKVRMDKIITHRFPIAEALQAYDLILKNQEPYIGVLLRYPENQDAEHSEPLARKVFLKNSPGPQEANRRTVGLIGGGLFTKNILLPALKQVQDLQLAGVATTSGVTSQHLAQKFGFTYATTDYREVLDDPAIGSVVITTRHDLHASLVLEALAAGKHVLVEKPLCLAEDELRKIESAYNGSQLLMVGFNRRFSSLTQKVKALISGRTTPLVMMYRVNAGYIPEDHWVHDPELGGGRLLGEVCHFVDYLHFLADSETRQVSLAAISGAKGKYRADDNLSLTLSFLDGSIGTIIYTAKGTKAFCRERFEVFGEETVAVIEDFRRAQLIQAGRARTIKKIYMDMGYVQELEAFFHAPFETLDPPRLFASYASSTLTTLLAFEALQTGQTIQIANLRD